MAMAERYPEAELVLDDELLYDEGPRRSAFIRRDDRPEDIVREGELLAGKYRVERIPGRSGLGVLVQVRHVELGQDVTLKFLVPEACAYPEFVQRFVREARAAVRIQGEHVARVTDVGRLESGAPYMVREFLRGPDLAEVIKVRGQLPISEAVDYIIQAAEGVAEGHALGVVHRNLRPTSLVVVRRSDGTALVKVFDFAAAESLHVNPFTEHAVALVGTSAIMGSLPYLAPEQIRDPHDVDVRADVYSLGAILYELLTGTALYAADSAPALLAQVVADPAPALRDMRPDTPSELEFVVLRCLSKNRAVRYANMAELVLALQHFASEEVTTSIERIARLAKRSQRRPELAAQGAPVEPPPLPKETAAPVLTRGRLVAAGALVALATFGIALAGRSLGPSRAAAAAPPPIAAPPRVQALPPKPSPAMLPTAAASGAVSAAKPTLSAASGTVPARPSPIAAAQSRATVPPVSRRLVPKAASGVPLSAAAPRLATPLIPAEGKSAPAADLAASARPATGGDLFDDPR